MNFRWIVFFALTARVFAWDNLGHEVVAAFAYPLLTDTAKHAVDDILAADPRARTFIDAATWPDDIKFGRRNDPTAHLNKAWHYVNLPYDSRPEDIQSILDNGGVRVDPRHEKSANVVTAIRYYRDFLAHREGSPLERADALSWLIHLIGDVHQPLHCITIIHPLPNYTPPTPHGDEGGNGFAVTGTPHELHALWDDALDEGSRSVRRTEDPQRVAESIRRHTTLTAKQVGISDPADWARESFSVRERVYELPLNPRSQAHNPTHTVPNSYRTWLHDEATQRIALAGARLATVLNRAFASP